MTHETRHSKPVHWDIPEGWDEERGGRGVQHRETHVHPWLVHVNVWQKTSQYCKVISIQLKQINLKKRILHEKKSSQSRVLYVAKPNKDILRHSRI